MPALGCGVIPATFTMTVAGTITAGFTLTNAGSGYVTAPLVHTFQGVPLHIDGGFSGDEAEQKSIELLKQWLTPRQLKDFEKTNSFTVQGNVTSKFYKIERRSTFNVGELNTNNQRVRSLCFVPAYAYAIGDIMLAQKIMLETREDEVLKIANFSGGPTDPAGQHLYEQLAETTRRATGRSLFQRVFG